MLATHLQNQLEPVVRRVRRWRTARALAVTWGAFAVVGAIVVLAQRQFNWSGPAALVVFGAFALLATAVVGRRSSRWHPDYREIAREIEHHHPDLHALLLTAVEQKPDASGQLSYLQERVVREAIILSHKQQWIDAVSSGRMLGTRLAQLAALAALLWAGLGLRSASLAGSTQGTRLAQGVTVTPGDASIERGSALVVMARFDGTVPAEATLVLGTDTNTARRLPLARNLSDPVFGGTVSDVTSNLVYHVEFDGRQTRDFKVTVYEHPRLERADAHFTFPEYSGLGRKTVPDTRRVSAVQGTRLDWVLYLNKPVASATLIDRQTNALALATIPNQAMAALSNYVFDTSAAFDLRLVDAEGRTNKVPARFFVEALTNRMPELKIVSPRGDQRVSPLEEVHFEAEAWDDFGLRGYGLAYKQPGREPQILQLGTNAAANQRVKFGHLLPFENLGVEPAQLVTYFLWADDVGPDGKLRRSASDMFFAEVRPFEEIFREGMSQDSQDQQQQQQQQQGQNPVEKLGELQKQVINATWKLQRQETGREDKPSEQYLKDAPVLKESQQAALDLADQLKERLTDPRLAPYLDNATREMQQAIDKLADAEKSAKPLPEALDAEQSAYQSLLKLAAREYQVSRNRSQRGQQQARNSQMQRQLDQLDLQQSENRYETQRQAQSPVDEQQREQLQVLNRLKELAQRQQDLNERIKELQSELQAAQTDQEREELQRRLKRLREEQQSLLADADELRQRMERGENQSSMAEARRQLEQARSQMQRAAEALDRQAAQQALAEGARAQRNLQQTAEEMRDRSARQFTEEMRQMRQDARQLAQKQEAIGQKLESLTDTRRKTLSDSDQVKALTNQLAQQKVGLTNLLSQMRTVSERSENVEPLLSRQLYETLRQNSQRDTEKSLEAARQLADRNFLREAAPFEQMARNDISNLKQGVERAAESILGNDTEALRRARRELDDLTRQLDNEIARNEAQANPSPSQQQQQAQSGQRGQPSQHNQPGQQGQQRQPGQQGQQGESSQQAQAGQQGQGQPQNQQAQNAPPGQGQRPNQEGQQGGQQPDQQNQPAQQGGGQSQGERNQQAQQGGGQQDQQNQSDQQQQQGQGQGQGQQQQQQPNQQAQGGQQGQQQQPQGNQPAQSGQRGGQQPGQQQGQQNQQQSQQNQQNAQAQQGQGQGQGQGQPNQQQQTQLPGQQAQQNQQGQQPGQGRGQAQQPVRDQNQRNPQQQAQPQQQPPQPGQRDPQQARVGGPGTRTPDRLNPQQQESQQRTRTGINPGQRFFDPASDSDPNGGELGPITGNEFTEWSDRLRDVEEMVEIPELRNQVAQARDRARTMRNDLKRHGKAPQWPMVRTQVAAPLAEVKTRISEELARRESNEALVPIDRDPVPTKYSELVRRYYEKLGSEK